MTDKATENLDAMKETFENIFSLEKMTERFTKMSDDTREKYTKYNNDLIAISPIIEEIGFKTTQITLSMGLPPSFTFHFEKFKDIAPERREEILFEHKENQFLSPVVRMLIAADNYQSKIKLGSFKFSCIEIQLGLTPGINMVLIPK
jgi:hypothetical protein